MNKLNSNYINPNLKNEDDDDDDDFPRSTELYMNYGKKVRPVVQITISIDEIIKSPKYYRIIVQELASLSSEDEVIIYINSPGGDLHGLVSLLEAIRLCEAEILAVITGRAHSAASMLALACPNVAITPYSNMLVHFVSFGTGGKATDVLSNVQHTIEYSKLIFKDIYQGFLTNQEMQDVISGKELWLQSAEIDARLTNRQKFLEEVAAEAEVAKEVKPKKVKVELVPSPTQQVVFD